MITKPTTYTADFVQQELDHMLERVLTDNDVVYIGQLFEDRPYSRQRYSEWVNQFSDEPQISDTIKRIDELLETKLVTKALGNKLNPTITIFTLKNKYNWKDKTEQDLHVKELPKPILGGLSASEDDDALYSDDSN